MPSSLIAGLLALAAAIVFGTSSVFEQQATKQVPVRGALSVRLLLDLITRPMWVTAITVNLLGNVLQVLALHFGPLALVQPILVGNLLFAVLIASVTIRHRPPDRILLVGVICCAAGIACFVIVAHPSGGRQTVSFPDALPLILGLAAVIAICLAVARLGPARARPLMLALACGVDFGVTAFLLKLVSHTLQEGFGDPARQWPLYAVAIIGPIGFMLNQSAFQAGILISPVLAIITTVDPLVSIGIAHFLLDENIRGSAADVAVEVLSLIVMTGGIIALAHRAPQAARQLA